MMSNEGIRHQIITILLVVANLCLGHDVDDFKVMLRRYDTNLCLMMKTTNPETSPKVHSLALQPCQWNQYPGGMAFSILPLEPSEPIETEDDIKHIVDEHLIRISGSSCLISAADNYSLKPGRCNVRSARFFIEKQLIGRRRDGPRVNVTVENSDYGDPRTITNIYGFYFKQGGSCLTDQTTGSSKYVKLSPVAMSPCIHGNMAQLWSICSIAGDCLDIILKFFNLPLHPPTTIPPPTTTKKITTTRRTTTTTKPTTTTTTTTTISTSPTSTTEIATVATEEPIKDVHVPTVMPMSCNDSSIHHENSSCITKSSSLQQLSSWTMTILVLCLCRLL